jgi:putative PIN family toxin of toxin-antitoxin system
VIRATLDTNALASGFAGEAVPASTPGAIVRRWRAGRFELVVSPDILTELSRTFAKPYYTARRSRAQIAAAVQLVSAEATVVVPTVVVSGVATHPEDDRVLAAAVSARVDYLVTGDRQLRRLGSYRGVRILSPREFLDVLELAEGEEP